jgi:hypothetical protein
MREVSERPQFVLNEAILIEAETDNINYEFSYIFNGSKYEEDDFKQKLILVIKSTGSISVYSAIPEVVDLIMQGLKEGSKARGFAYFKLGTASLLVRAKKVLNSNNEIQQQ